MEPTPIDHKANLKAICEQIKDALSLDIDKDSPDELMGKLQVLTTMLGTISHAISLANMIYSQKLMELTQANEYRNLSATDKKMVFAGKARTEGYYVDMTAKLSSSLVHTIDGIRSILSYKKQEMSNLPSR